MRLKAWWDLAQVFSNQCAVVMQSKPRAHEKIRGKKIKNRRPFTIGRYFGIKYYKERVISGYSWDIKLHQEPYSEPAIWSKIIILIKITVKITVLERKKKDKISKGQKCNSNVSRTWDYQAVGIYIWKWKAAKSLLPRSGGSYRCFMQGRRRELGLERGSLCVERMKTVAATIVWTSDSASSCDMRKNRGSLSAGSWFLYQLAHGQIHFLWSQWNSWDWVLYKGKGNIQVTVSSPFLTLMVRSHPQSCVMSWRMACSFVTILVTIILWEITRDPLRTVVHLF